MHISQLWRYPIKSLGAEPLGSQLTVDGIAGDRIVHVRNVRGLMDRGWDVVRVNTGAARLFAGLCAPEPVPDVANVLWLMIEPGPVRAAVTNWHEVAPALLERARREAVGGVRT